MIQFDLLRVEGSTRIPTPVADDIRVDLELDKIIEVASNGDKLIAETWLNTLLLKDSSEDAVRYRQEAVKDALVNRNAILSMYSIARDTLERVRRDVFIFRRDDPSSITRETARGIGILVDGLNSLLSILKSTNFSSKAFRDLAASLTANINESFISSARYIVGMFDYNKDIVFSVKVGSYNYLRDPVLLVPKDEGSLFSRLLSFGKEYTYRLDPRDEAGPQILHDIKNWVLLRAASILLDAYNKMRRFFEDLMKQLSFYVGAINMSDFFTKMGLPQTYPDISSGRFAFEDLHCLSLAISSSRKPVPSTLEVNTDGAFAVLITGANRGGKTTFLKAVGQAILLARAGLFIPAKSFTIPAPGAVYTHFLRGEDRTLSYGKFEEEVRRFRGFAGLLRRGDFVLMDESFSSTNPVEASVVAENVVSALADSGVNVFYVTFLQDFIYNFTRKYGERAVLLVPERLSNGERTFRLVMGTLQPGFAMDLWAKLYRETMSGNK
ncbi:MAG: hypothetical protein RQ842_00650 [Vulcanisaeta sp.]|nr:hypothetical protein [Vulcanisaeta sp.]